MSRTDMSGPDTPEPLLETLRLAQRLGFFGSSPIERAAEHARAFVAAIGDVPPDTRIADIGSGGGLPGLVVAAALPHARIVLIDRREKRTDFLHRSVQKLGYDHVTVRCRDVEDVARSIDRATEEPFGVVTARGFGPPDVTLRLSRRLLGTGAGCIVISEPPVGERWDPGEIDRLGLRSERLGPVIRFDRVAVD